MIRIFNRKLQVEIRIDDQLDFVQLTPRDYDDEPFVLIELNGANFLHHAQNCSECSQFIKALGTRTVDWYIEYSGKVRRVDTQRLGLDHGKSHIRYVNNRYFNGTKMCIGFNPLPLEKEALEKLLREKVLQEDYEEACILRDLIKEDTTA